MPRYQYSKHHLVPFGEFIPTGFHWFVRLMSIPLGDFNRGDLNQSSFSALGQRIAPNICYEDVFGEEIIRQLPEAGLLPRPLPPNAPPVIQPRVIIESYKLLPPL